VTALNRLLAGATDVALAPLAYVPPLAGLALISLATAVALLLVVRRTSNQAQLAAVKRAIHAGFFELRLFGDDVPAIFRTELEMLRHSLTYLRLSFVPVLWLIVPLTLAIIHLDYHFGYTGLGPGTSALVTATLAGDAPQGATAGSGAGGVPSLAAPTLEAPPSIRVETPAVWFRSARELVWRITPRTSGHYVVRVHVGGETFAKTLRVSDAVARRSPVRLKGSALDQVLNPSEPPLPEGPLTSIAITYPHRDIRILGWEMNWLVAYFIMSFAFMLALRRPLGVII
jgi:hypothetical protein